MQARPSTFGADSKMSGDLIGPKLGDEAEGQQRTLLRLQSSERRMEIRMRVGVRAAQIGIRRPALENAPAQPSTDELSGIVRTGCHQV